METATPHLRFKEARERLGLSLDEVAKRSGLSDASIWDIEEIDGDLTSCYSPKEVQQFCRALAVRPVELFGDAISEPAVSPKELVQMIHDECRSRNIKLEQFEDIVGWRLAGDIEPPEKLLEGITIDGLQWVCGELRIDWRRVLLAL